MTDTPISPDGRFDRDGVAVLAVVFAAFAVVASLIAVGVAARAAADARAGGGAPVTASASATFELTEFAIDPGDASVAAGSVVQVTNAGKAEHNLSVDGVASEIIDGGAETTLDLSGLAPGTYAMQCDVPGHADAGMTGTITIE